MSSKTCVFCRIVGESVPAHIVYQDETVTAFREAAPQAPVHILIVPNCHISSLNAIDDEADQSLLGALLVTARKLASELGLDQKGYRLVLNTGPQAGQSVYHLHVHLLAGRQMQWPPG